MNSQIKMHLSRLQQLKSEYDRKRDEYVLALGAEIDDSDPKEIARLRLDKETEGIIKDYLELFCFPEYVEAVEAEIKKIQESQKKT